MAGSELKRHCFLTVATVSLSVFTEIQRVITPHQKGRYMRPSRQVTMSGTLSLILVGWTSITLCGTARAATVAPCGADGIAGTSSCTYLHVGEDSFTVPSGVHSADFTADGAQAATGTDASQVSARLNVSPGETFQINVGGANLSAGSSGVSAGSSTTGTRVLVASGGGTRSATNYVTPTATSVHYTTTVHEGSGEVTVAWTPSSLEQPTPPLPPVPPLPTPSTPPGISIPGLSLNLGALLSGVTSLVAGLLGGVPSP
jgi:hypothetical protein